MPFVYHSADGSIQGFSREHSDIPLGEYCAPISQEDFEILSAIPTGFKMDLTTDSLKAHTITDHEQWIRWIPVVLNHRYIDGEFVPLAREPTPLEEWMRESIEGTESRAGGPGKKRPDLI
jgi:hypothetical protein